MSGVEIHGHDGSTVRPLGWQHVSGGDWEIYATRRPMEAVLYDEDVPVVVVRARTRIGLAWKMRRATPREPS